MQAGQHVAARSRLHAVGVPTSGVVPPAAPSQGARGTRRPAAAALARRPPPPAPWAVRLTVWSMHVAYAGLLLRSFFAHSSTLRHGGRLLLDISATVLILAGLNKLFVERQDGRFARAFVPVYVFLGACLLAGAVGAAHGNTVMHWVLIGFMPFVGAATMAIGDEPSLFSALFRTVLYQTYVGAAFATYVLVFAPPAGRQDWWGPHGENLASMAAQSLYGLSFVLPYVHALPRRHALAVSYALCAFMALHFIGVNRTPMLTFGLILPLLLAWVMWRRHRSLRPWLHIGRHVGTVVLAGALALALVLPTQESLFGYLGARLHENTTRLIGSHASGTITVEGISSGLLESSSVEFLGHSNRGGELREFLEQMQPVDYLVGRGFGGTWTSLFWGSQWPMVHIGPAHLLLVGGLPFLLAFYAATAAAVAACHRALPHALAMPGVLCFLADFSLAFLQHGMLRESHSVFLFWLCCGMALACRHRGATALAADPALAGEQAA